MVRSDHFLLEQAQRDVHGALSSKSPIARGVFESAESSKLKITGERIFTKKTEDGTGKSDSDKPRRATYETFQKLIGNIHSTSPRTERSFVLRELRSLV